MQPKCYKQEVAASGSVAMAVQYTLPGRLGHEDMTLETDPRTNAKLQPIMKVLKFTRNVPQSKLSPSTSSMEEIKELAAAFEHMIGGLYQMLPSDLVSSRYPGRVAPEFWTYMYPGATTVFAGISP